MTQSLPYYQYEVTWPGLGYPLTATRISQRPSSPFEATVLTLPEIPHKAKVQVAAANEGHAVVRAMEFLEQRHVPLYNTWLTRWEHPR